MDAVDAVDAETLEDVVLRWHAGWVRSRGMAPPREIPGGLRVEPARPERRFELVASDADADPASIDALAAAARAEAATTWVSVATQDPVAAARRLRANGLTVRVGPEQLMSVALAAHPRREVLAGYRLTVIEDAPGVLAAGVSDPSGETAATGRMAVIGADAVADMIVTHAAHRRRGLGGAVMSALARAAVERGARYGLLVASQDGQQLYGSLGWSRVADVVIGSTT